MADETYKGHVLHPAAIFSTSSKIVTHLSGSVQTIVQEKHLHCSASTMFELIKLPRQKQGAMFSFRICTKFMIITLTVNKISNETQNSLNMLRTFL